MREKLTFAVDANGLAYYIEITDRLKHQLSVEEQGACIDDWPGDFPQNLAPGFYSATLDVAGSMDSPDLSWSQVQKLNAYPPWAKVTRLPEAEVKERKPRHKSAAIDMDGEPQVRVRRKGEVIL